MADLLLELFSEEIPARMQTRAAGDLKKLICEGLADAGLCFEEARAFSTPRRLTLSITDLADESPAISEERKGPRTDAPDQAIEGFLRSTGLSKDDLEVRDDKKGQVYFAIINKPGRAAADIIAELVPNTIRNFPWPKSMRWGAGNLRWVRPLHSILCLLSEGAKSTPVSFDIDGIEAGHLTAGHRFHAPEWFSVKNFEDYKSALLKSKVILDAEERAAKIWKDAQEGASNAGLDIVEDQGLLREVAGLVEWPVVLMGEIAEDFLDLPPEVLQTSMREHQKFFSVRDPKSGRIVKFVTVANRETADKGATILAGNQKVLFARLSDAKFFWENDLRVAKSGLATWTNKLADVTFHNKLGTQAERIARIAKLAREMASWVGADVTKAERAALFAKADLSSEMVYEFPELQGLMGRYYVEASGEDKDIAAVAEEHYSPLGPSDDVPIAPLSVAVSLADKIDTLSGFWAIDEKPTGSKDPFALRRAALGVIRLILENNVRASLTGIFDKGYAGADTADLLQFFHDRLKVYLRDQGISHDVIDACIAMDGNDDIALLVARARALQAFLKTDDGENLVQGFKRANNILSAEEAKDGVSYELDPDPKLAESAAEKTLFAALEKATPLIATNVKNEAFDEAMQALAALREPIDSFFNAVQVNAESAIIRRNRLCMLNTIRVTMRKIAEFDRLEGV